MKNSFRKFLVLALISLLTACIPSLETATTAGGLPLAGGTNDPASFSVSLEINQRLSNEEIMYSLFTRWLEHWRDKTISPPWRIEAYDIEGVSESALDHPCAQKMGALFLLEIQVYIKTTNPIICAADCEQSAWTTEGSDIMDAFGQVKSFSGAVFKSGNMYTLHVIPAVPACDPAGN